MTKSNFPCNGNVLLFTLMAVLVVSLFVTVALSRTSQNGRNAKRQEVLSGTSAAADGAIEYAFAAWKQKLRELGLRAATNTDLNRGLSTAVGRPDVSRHPGFTAMGINFSGYDIQTSDQWGNPEVTPPPKVPTEEVPNFPGWKGTSYHYRVEVSAAAATISGSAPRSGIRRFFQLTQVPLFQAAIFYEGDLELHPGAPMTVSGLVHTNKDLWAAGFNALQFKDKVSYVNEYRETAMMAGWDGNGGAQRPTVAPTWSDGLQGSSSTTKGKQLSQVERMEPFGNTPENLYSRTDVSRNNDGPHELIEPPLTGVDQTDPAEIAGSRVYSQATLKIEINSALTGTARVSVRNSAGTLLATTDPNYTAVLGALDSGVTMMDWREGTNVKVTSVDMVKLTTAAKAFSGYNGVIHVRDVSTAGKTAIRLKNGRALPLPPAGVTGVTIASDNAVYVQGDYNTGGTSRTDVPSNVANPDGQATPTASGYTRQACAIMADAITVLSNAWNDSNASSGLGSRKASATTINAAFLCGDVPTNAGTGKPSGGAHNFPRFLEAWSEGTVYTNFTYWGSMVQAFNSESFTGAWQTGNVYSWPNRKWNFDPKFLTAQPPGTPQGIQYSRGRWERF